MSNTVTGYLKRLYNIHDGEIELLEWETFTCLSMFSNYSLDEDLECYEEELTEIVRKDSVGEAYYELLGEFSISWHQDYEGEWDFDIDFDKLNLILISETQVMEYELESWEEAEI